MGYALTSNFKHYPLFCKADLPPRAAEDFDYVDNDDYSNRFVCYRGTWYDVSDSQAIRPINARRELPVGWSYPVHPGEPLARFDCIITESYFSGVAFKYVDGFEGVVCARIYG